MTELNPLTPDVPAGLAQVPINRLVDVLTVEASTIAQVRGFGVVTFRFSSTDPDGAWPLPILYAGRPDDLRRMGRVVQATAFRAANLAEGKP